MANENDEIEKDGEESDEAKKLVASPSSSPAPVASAAGAGALADEAKGAVEGDEIHDAEAAEEPVVAKATKTEAAPPARPALPSEPADEGPEPAPERDSPGMRLITTAFVVVAIAVIGIVIGTKEYFTSVMDAELETKVAEPVSNQLLELHKIEDARLSKYQWISKEKGVVRIPVDKAKEMVLARYQSEPIEEPPPPPPPTTGEVPVEPPPDAPGGEKDGKDGTKPGKDGEKQPEAPVPPPPQEKAPEKKKAPVPPPPPGEPVP